MNPQGAYNTIARARREQNASCRTTQDKAEGREPAARQVIKQDTENSVAIK